MVWFSILKYYKRDSDGSYSWFNWKDYDSRRRADKQNKNREDFLKIIANNAELELPEIEQRAAEAEKNFRECTIKLCPIAVVSNPSNSRYGNCDENAERSKKKRTGIKTMVITVV